MIENHLLVIEQHAARAEVFPIPVASVEEPPRADTGPVATRETDSVCTDDNTAEELSVHENRISALMPERAEPQADWRSRSRSAQGSGRCLAYTKENSGIDIANFITGLQSSGLERQHIGGENNNCWMRSAWLSSFIQCDDPARMKQRMREELGDRLIEKMPPRPQTEGTPTDHFPTIAEQIEIIYNAILDFKAGRLQQTHENGAGPFRKNIDDAITVLSQALLMKNLKDDGLQGSAASARIASIDSATIYDGMGDTDQIRIIMRMLGFDMFVVSPENSYIEIGIAPGSELDNIAPSAPAANTHDQTASKGVAQLIVKDMHNPPSIELLDAAGRKTPPMLQEGVHFELYTQRNLWCARS